MIHSRPFLYSNSTNKNLLVDDNIKVKVQEKFVLTATKTIEEVMKQRKILYYWKLVRGLTPSIAKVTDDGRNIFLYAPDKPCRIVFELKVVDSETKESDTNVIEIEVVN